MMARNHVALAAGVSAVAAAWSMRTGIGGLDDLPRAAAFVAIGAGAGLLPDVDEPGSSAPHTLGWLGMGVAHLIRLIVRKHRGATHTIEVAAGTCLLLAWLAVPHPGWVSTVAGWPRVGGVLAWLGVGHPLVVAVACGLAVAIGADTIRGVHSMQALAVGAAVAAWLALAVGPGEWWPVAAIFVGWVAHLLGDTPTPHGVPWSVFALFGDHRLSFRWFTTGSAAEPVFTWVAVALLVVGAWALAGGRVVVEVQRLSADFSSATSNQGLPSANAPDKLGP